MYDVIQLFGKDVRIKNYYCSSNINKIPRSESKLHLYIKVTDACPATCSYCGNRGMEDYGNIDIGKLKYVLEHLHSQNRLHGVSISGGEPMLNFNKVNEIINTIVDTTGIRNISISTNGHNIKKILDFDNVDKLESVHISRHHYSDEVNKQIFGVNTANVSDIRYVIERLKNTKLLVLNCLLMKKYINNLVEVKRFLDFAGELNVFKAGFVSLMKVNDFSIDNFINFNEIFNNLDECFLRANHFYDQHICECCDGIYYSEKNGTLTEFYARMTKELNCDYTRQLVYTSDNRLTTGFGKESLI
jgi:molybdenum cofactor biosynthesis enzyme MoaA